MFRRFKVQFFPWSIVQFVLYFLYPCILEIVEISRFRYVLPNKFVGILNRALLPSRIGIGEVNHDLPAAFPAQPLGYFQMSCELRAVVRGYVPDIIPEGEKQPYHGSCRWQGFPTLFKPFHYNVIGRAFHQGQYGVTIPVHDGVHLPFPLVADVF